jgi:hypothetical protein
VPPLVVEQPALAHKAVGVAGQGAICSDQATAGNDDADGGACWHGRRRAATDCLNAPASCPQPRLLAGAMVRKAAAWKAVSSDALPSCHRLVGFIHGLGAAFTARPCQIRTFLGSHRWCFRIGKQWIWLMMLPLTRSHRWPRPCGVKRLD